MNVIDQIAVLAVLAADAFSPVQFEDEGDLAPEQMAKKISASPEY
jgi:hypothetical protein